MAEPARYELPKSWPASDVLEWIKATLDEPGVASIELARNASGGLDAFVHSK